MKFQGFIFILLTTLTSSALAAGDVVATVNGKPIKQSNYDLIVKNVQLRGQKLDGATHEAIINDLVDKELLAQEAQRLGLDKQPELIAREELTRREFLVNTFVQDYLKKNPILDSEIKAAYEQYKKAYGDKEINAWHILVKTEAEAKDIIAQLNRGGDFAKIAKEKSLDLGSKDRGGDLGWFSPATKVRVFSDVAANLNKGSISNSPVQTQFGWHVIKLIDTRPAQPLSYERVKEELMRNLQQVNIDKLLVQVRSKAKININ